MGMVVMIDAKPHAVEKLTGQASASNAGRPCLFKASATVALVETFVEQTQIVRKLTHRTAQNGFFLSMADCCTSDIAASGRECSEDVGAPCFFKGKFATGPKRPSYGRRDPYEVLGFRV